MSYFDFERFLILFGALIAFLIGLTQLLLSKKNGRNYLIVLVFFDTALFQITGNSFVFRDLKNWHDLFPITNIVGSMSIYALLPLTYLWLMALSRQDFRIKPSVWPHFVPAVIVGIALTLFERSGLNTSVSPEEYRGYLFDTSVTYKFVAIGSWIQTAYYGIRIVIAYLPAIRRANVRKRLNLLTVYMVVGMMAYSTVVCIGYYFAREAFTLVYETRLTLFAVLIFLASYRYPFLLNIIKLEAYRDGYMNPRLNGLDAATILERIERLMTGEGLYRDGNLNLKKMSGKLGITAHQLSEIMNTRLGKSFPQYLKEKRVAAAQEMMRSEPELKIITIAADCGFNSLSVFNASFKSVAGMTPSQYKAQVTSADILKWP